MVWVVFWLFMATPIMYFRLLHTSYGLMSVIAWLGLLGLIGGLALGLRSGRKGLLWFLVPFLLGQFYFPIHIGLASLFQAVSFPGGIESASLVFLAILAAIVLAIVNRLKGVRLAAASLSVFCLAYSVTAVALAYL